jgi:diguanylate cyclase (GGDEF)-like protein
MDEKKHTIRFIHSIAFQSTFILVSALVLIGGVGSAVFLHWQSNQIQEQTFQDNHGSLKRAMASIQSEMDGFKSRLTLLAATNSITELDPVKASSFLKSYNMSTLFIPGEYVSLYDGNYAKLTDNSMVGTLHYPEFNDFSKVLAQRPFVSPLFWVQSTPQKFFAVIVENRATANGFLVASFSFRRLWTTFSNYKAAEKSKYFVLFNSDGTILYHPDLKRWINTPHSAEDLGLQNFDPMHYTVTGPTTVILSDKEEYLVDYIYDPTYRIGLMSLQPKAEVTSQVWKSQTGLGVMILFFLIIIVFSSVWLVAKVGHPLNKLTERILKVSDGNYDIPDDASATPKKNDDEVRVLAEVFEEMRKTIRSKILELAEHKAHLEMEVMERTRDLEKANLLLEQISRTDELTGLPNRRDIREKISYEMNRSERTKRPFSFIFIDIDKFKNFNDTYGHVCGDIVLKTVSVTMRNLLRKHDFIARWGGEEFLAVLPETDIAGAMIVAERFRKTVAQTDIVFAECKLNVTITLGVSLFDPRLGMDRSIDLADRALYKGKQNGRNQVIVFDPKDITQEDLQAAEMERKINAGILKHPERRETDHAPEADEKDPRGAGTEMESNARLSSKFIL